jgi:hypothetical protein
MTTTQDSTASAGAAVPPAKKLKLRGILVELGCSILFAWGSLIGWGQTFDLAQAPSRANQAFAVGFWVGASGFAGGLIWLAAKLIRRFGVWRGF